MIWFFVTIQTHFFRLFTSVSCFSASTAYLAAFESLAAPPPPHTHTHTGFFRLILRHPRKFSLFQFRFLFYYWKFCFTAYPLRSPFYLPGRILSIFLISTCPTGISSRALRLSLLLKRIPLVTYSVLSFPPFPKVFFIHFRTAGTTCSSAHSLPILFTSTTSTCLQFH